MDFFSQKIEELTKDLVSDGMITADQLAVAQESQKNLGGSLGEILVARGYVSEKDLFKKLGKKHGFSMISLSTYQPDTKILKLLTVSQANQWKVIPLFEVEDKVTVATSDPFNLPILDELRIELGRDIDCVLVPPSEVKLALNKFYQEASIDTSEVSVEVVQRGIVDDATGSSPQAQLEREAQASKVISSVNQILQQAYQERASDIHLEATRDAFKVRVRIDGILEELKTLPRSMHQSMTSRIKIMGGMDVAEQRVPQDGRVRVRITGHEIDLRIATYPTQFGEKTTIRLLTKEKLITLEDLGLAKPDRETLEYVIARPHGIFLVTGPTGSGKTTTLYSALKRINRKNKNVLTIEDPIENEIEGVNQTAINVKAGLTFASSIRAMLRQDPDIIMVGEIRDQETADIAIRAAMTGHFVFSSLHTNTAVGAVMRLIDLDVEPFLVASSLTGVMTQRLVRRVCQKCKQEVVISENEAKILCIKESGMKAFRGKGCKECRMTGYKGRVGIFEIFKTDDALANMISKGASEVDLHEKLTTHYGYHSLLEDGLEKIKLGITTVEEVIRVAVEV